MSHEYPIERNTLRRTLSSAIEYYHQDLPTADSYRDLAYHAAAALLLDEALHNIEDHLGAIHDLIAHATWKPS